VGHPTSNRGQPGHPAPRTSPPWPGQRRQRCGCGDPPGPRSSRSPQAHRTCAAARIGRCTAGRPSRHGTRDSDRSSEPRRSTTMSRTTSGANGGGIAAELRDWARGCHSTEAAVGLLIRARSGRFPGAGSTMAAHRQPRNHLARSRGDRAVRGCRVLRRAPHFGARRGARAWQAARRCGRSHGQLGPLPSWPRLCRVAARRLWQRSNVIPQKTPQASGRDD
jgi:hypothetical protein